MSKYTNPLFDTVSGEEENRTDNICYHKSDLIGCYTGEFMVSLQNKLIVAQQNKLITVRQNKLIVAQQDKLKEVHHALNNLKSGGGH
ncbi:MAG: hypothetical protein LIR40_09850 [Bacteroidota bacterium]|nr:hypothetical protein [Bacteroidota bacterium]